MSARPSEPILSIFGIKDAAILLEGGEGTTLRAGDVVLKPAGHPAEADWRAALLDLLVEDGFRVPRPVKSINGRWVEDGWCAYRYAEGEEVEGRWSEKIAISQRFHAALRDVPRPDFLDTVSHPWAIADRMTWGTLPMQFGERLRPVMSRIQRLLNPVDLSNQLIHGDMTGNILFHPSLPPAIIDLSPYWHPAEYADAIIAADALSWEDAPETLIDELGGTPETHQLLLRAAMWRIKTTEEYISQYHRGNINDVDAYDRLIALLERRLG